MRMPLHGKYNVVFSIAVVLYFSVEAFATKPCPSNPCYGESGALLPSKCQELAEWVVLGTLSRIQHRAEGTPLNKDFSQFSVEVSVWEKGEQNAKTIDLEIEWCSPTLEKKLGQKLRIYGTSDQAGRHVIAFE